MMGTLTLEKLRALTARPELLVGKSSRADAEFILSLPDQEIDRLPRWMRETLHRMVGEIALDAAGNDISGLGDHRLRTCLALQSRPGHPRAVRFALQGVVCLPIRLSPLLNARLNEHQESFVIPSSIPNNDSREEGPTCDDPPQPNTS